MKAPRRRASAGFTIIELLIAVSLFLVLAHKVAVVMNAAAKFSEDESTTVVLEDQAHLFTLLDPARIGVELTEEWELVPEQSTSAVVCHHRSARYFNIV